MSAVGVATGEREPRTPIVAFEAVGFRYPSAARAAVDALSLEIDQPTVVGIAGQNGSGKTTLVKLVNGLLRPDTGRVLVEGVDTARTDPRRLAARAGLVFQNPGHQLFASTVAEELAFGPRNLGLSTDEIEVRVARAASLLDLDDVLHEHPYRLGLARRKLVAVASVLSMQPSILILDEPTTGQDHRTVDVLARLVASLHADGTTVLLVAHDMAFLAETAERLVVLESGRVIGDGTPRALFADDLLLTRAGLAPPQVTQLALRLSRPPRQDPTVSWPPLTVPELVDALRDGGVRPDTASSDVDVRTRSASGGLGRNEVPAIPGRAAATPSAPPVTAAEMRVIGPPAAAAERSWLARMSPIPKLAWLVAVLAVALVTYHPLPLLVIIAVAATVAVSAGLVRPVLAGLVVLAPLAASIVIVQSTAPGICGACTPAATVGPITIYQEGLARSLSLIARVMAMELTAIVVFASTRAADLVAALGRLHVPYAVSFMLAMTLELVPVVRREVGVVLAAQRARAMRGSGFGAVIPAFVPVFVGTIERMQRLAVSLEARGFGVTGPRTSYRRVRFGVLDRLIALAAVIAGTVGVVLGLVAWGADRVPALDLPAPLAIGVVLASVLVFVGVVVAGVRAIARA